MNVVVVFSLLLLSASLLTADFGDVYWNISCTATCQCYNDRDRDDTFSRWDNSTDASRQVIICSFPPENDTRSLSEEVASYLKNLPRNVSSALTSLKIKGPLDAIPDPICRMSSLMFLYLNGSRFDRFPDNCLNRLSKLVVFRSSNGRLTELQDGLFDGLRYLKQLYLTLNQIAHIGTHLFSEASGLDSLAEILLEKNKLTTLDAWAFVRARIGVTQNDYVSIRLDHNQIARFTNKIGWRQNCSDFQLSVQLVLNGNQIRHIDDIVRGWGLNWTECDVTVKCRINVEENNLSCDCIDYDFRSAFRTNFNKWIFWGVLDCPDPTVCDITDDCPTGCKCLYSRSEKAVKIGCSSAGLISLPSKLPALKTDSRYVIDFSNNLRLTKLDNSSFIVNTKSFDVSNSGVDTMEDVVARQLFQKVDVIRLNGNRLKSLPKGISSFRRLTNFTQIDLSNNPWDCSCSNGWMIDWLNSMKQSLVNNEYILCDSPAAFNNKQFLRMTVEDLCENPTAKSTTIAIAVSLFVIALVVISFLLFVTLKIHPFDRDECEGEDMEYDVFFCSCSEDEDQHGNRILSRLESEGYKVCYHSRDFHGGRTINENMTEAIQRSKRTVCLISENFLRSSYCIFEFEQAFDHYLLKLRKNRLIALVQLDDPSSTISAAGSATLLEFIRRYTYIEYNQMSDDSVWLNKLLYALPVKGIQQQLQQQSENLGNDGEVDDEPTRQLQSD